MRSLLVLALCLLAAVALTTSSPSHVRLASRTRAPPGWTRTTRLHASYRISFIVALKQRNLDQLERLFWAVSEPTSPQYQQFMQPEEITALIAPPKHDHDTVVSWLLSGGATIVKSYGDAIEASMTASDCETLFSTKLFLFKHTDGRRAARHWGHLSVPSHIAALVDLVSGLSEFPVPHYGSQRTPSPAKPLDGQLTVIPETVQASYQTPSSYSPKSATSQGVIEFEDQYFSNDDLANFAQQVGATIANVSNSTIVGFNNPAAPGGESTLDIQYIAGVGVGITNWFWIEADNVWLYGFAVHFFSTQQVPYVISVSYGWSENDQCEDGIGAQECTQLGVDSTGYVQRVNVEFQKIGLRGVSILVASGDSGANGRTDEDCTGSTLLPDFPTGSPFITSVGATEIHNAVYNLKTTPPACSGQGYACASGGLEAAVSYAQSNFASGGGFSNIASRPDYQSAAVSAYLSSGVALPPAGYYNTTSRGYPDVAAFGSGILIYQSGLQLTGGTSASTPIFAGVVALLNDYSLSATGKPLGFLNPLLYKMAAEQPSAFTDITVGDNKCTESGCASTCQGFLAAPGWDPVTGLGSPVYPQMLAYLRKFNEARANSAALL